MRHKRECFREGHESLCVQLSPETRRPETKGANNSGVVCTLNEGFKTGTGA